MIKYHQRSPHANNYIDLWLHNHQQNKQTNKQTKTKKYIRSGGRWNLINSARELEQNYCPEITETVALVIN